MEVIKEFIQNYGGELLLTAFTAVFAFFGTAFKSIIKKWADNKEKREVVDKVVMSVEQVYKKLHGTAKLEKAMETASAILCEKGINVTELELMTLIEASVGAFNDAFNKASWEQGIEAKTSEEESEEEITAEG